MSNACKQVFFRYYKVKYPNRIVFCGEYITIMFLGEPTSKRSYCVTVSSPVMFQGEPVCQGNNLSGIKSI